MKAIINGNIIFENKLVKDRILIFDKDIIGCFDEIPDIYKTKIDIIDVKGGYVAPGFISIDEKFNNIKYDFTNTDIWEYDALERKMASNGVTSYLASISANRHSELKHALICIKRKMSSSYFSGPRLLGVSLRDIDKENPNIVDVLNNENLRHTIKSIDTSIKGTNNIYPNTQVEEPQIVDFIKSNSFDNAKKLNIQNTYGVLSKGRPADIAIIDQNLECKMTFVNGKLKYEKLFTIKELKYALQSLPNVSVKSSSGFYLLNEYGSYRGNYEDIFIALNGFYSEAISSDKNITSHQLIDLLEESLEYGRMEGYKGGLFDVGEDTLVALSEYGVASDFYVNSVEYKDGCVVLNHTNSDYKA